MGIAVSPLRFCRSGALRERGQNPLKAALAKALTASLLLGAASLAHAGRDAAQLLAQAHENQQVYLHKTSAENSNAPTACTAKSLHLQLDHGPRATTTYASNQKKIADCQARLDSQKSS